MTRQRGGPSSGNGAAVRRVNPRDAMVKILHANCGKGKDSTFLALEKGVERGADLVVIQDPYQSKEEEYQIIHPAFRFIRGKTVMAEVRVDMMVTVDKLRDFGMQGSIQAFNITNRRGVQVRIVDVYDQTLQENNNRSSTRPARQARSDDLITKGNVVVCGDFIAHSPGWNSGCSQGRDASVLENLVLRHNLEIINDGQMTRVVWKENKLINSIIDIALVSVGR
jgi:hypothetical protein